MLNKNNSLESNALQNEIQEIKMQINIKIAQLDNLYVQIKIHHEGNYFKAFEVFDRVREVQRDFEKLDARLRLYTTASNLFIKGIKAKVVKI